jgi:hypothetical protein
MFLGTNAALRGCQEYFNRCAAAGSPIGATQTPSSYDNAASFNGTNQFLSVASNSSLTVTGTSFTYAFWANAVNTTPNQILISKRDAAGNAREYQIQISGGGLTFSVFPDGSFASTVSAVVTPISANSWNFYVCRYDASAGTIGASINGGAFTTTSSVPALTIVATNPVQFGANPGPVLYYTGQLSSIGFWKRALTAPEVTALWNSGAGRTYASLDTGLRTNLISWWALNGTSTAVSLTDSHTGGNNLTNSTNAVTAPNIGPVVTALSDPRQLIIDFAQGIDRLGLWNSMVCWPLRSSQNASTTQTAFSLGGGGTFNAALIGNPAWTSTGVIATGQQAGGPYVSSTYAMPASPMSYYAAIMQNPTSIGTNTGFYSTLGVGLNGRQFYLSTTANTGIDRHLAFTGNWRVESASITVTPPGYNTYTSSKFASWRVPDSSTMFVSLNNSQTSGAITGWDSSSPVGVLNPVTSCPAPVAFSCIFNTFVSNSLDSQISALYKQTLGLGLGLP